MREHDITAHSGYGPSGPTPSLARNSSSDPAPLRRNCDLCALHSPAAPGTVSRLEPIASRRQPGTAHIRSSPAGRGGSQGAEAICSAVMPSPVSRVKQRQQTPEHLR